MPEIKFTVPGDPVAKGRPRFVKMGKFTRAYTDKKTTDYESLVHNYAKNINNAPQKPLDCPVSVEIAFVWKRIKALCGKDRKGQYKHQQGRIPKTTTPDIDNTIKSILDGINDSGIWVDDNKVYSITAQKFYAAVDELPHVEVVIRWDDQTEKIEE